MISHHLIGYKNIDDLQEEEVNRYGDNLSKEREGCSDVRDYLQCKFIVTWYLYMRKSKDKNYKEYGDDDDEDDDDDGDDEDDDNDDDDGDDDDDED